MEAPPKISSSYAIAGDSSTGLEFDIGLVSLALALQTGVEAREKDDDDEAMTTVTRNLTCRK